MHASFFAGLIASLLPAAMRPKFVRDHAEDLRLPSMLTGFGQFLACVAFLIVGYPAFLRSQIDAINQEQMLRGLEKGGESAVMIGGIAMFFAYLFLPKTIALVYFAFEGAVRGIAAFIHNEPVGTLPLYVLLLASRKAKAEYHEHQLGPRIPDEVTVLGTDDSTCELKIASCRPKDWNEALTISYNENLYELSRKLEERPPRRFVYLLRRAPRSKVVRGLHAYDPEEVLADRVK